ncbi:MULTISPECIES: MFS transporter [Halolamina]|uniref:Predicted arabinose efflux permease, MFS family n=1 Tax=Halolamina pelagica TaxID=699431 RepID=A0A1I5RX10_9EURY|nr:MULTISPECIES: MFS transporter [Halolamina]NHX35368.1 MFS transporter [Halolamina sp. R1-12]SFP62526.1 Predicted arabinose efflux permease, MFS family [Halolamina pelagica]
MQVPTLSSPAIDDEDPSVPVVVGAVIAGVFFGGVGGGVAFPTLPTLGTVLGISSFVVGMILSVNRFTRLLLNTPAGQVLDRLGTRRPMLVGLVLQGLVPFGYVVALDPGAIPLSSAAIFFLSRALWGVGSAFVFVGAFTTVTHVTTAENRGKWVGYMRGGQSLGFPAGLILGGILTDLYGYSEAFAAAGVAGLFAAFVAFVVLPNVEGSASTTTRLRDLPAVVRADARVLGIGATNLAVRFLYAGILLSTVVLYTREFDIGLGSLASTGVSGIVMAISVLAMSVTTLVVGRLSDTLSSRTYTVIPALGLLAGGFALLALVPSVESTVVGVALVGIGVGGTGPPLMAYLGDIAPGGDVGKLGGVYNVFGDLGSTIGPLVALPFASVVGMRIEYLVCAGLAVLTATMVLATLDGDPETLRSPEAVPND